MVRTKKEVLPIKSDEVRFPASLEISDREVENIKETAARVGLTLEKYLQTIRDALSAMKVTYDKLGEAHEEPDTDKRLKAVLIGLEVQGYIKSKTSTSDNSNHTTVVYQWLQQNNVAGKQ